MSDITSTTPPRSSTWAWLWLAYTGFLFLDPILSPPSFYLWIGTLTVFAIFLGIVTGYVRSADNGTPIRYWMIVATFLLGLLTFPWNQGASTFFVYAACFIAFCVPSIRKILALFALEIAIVFAEGAYFHSVPGYFHISWPNTFIAIFLILVIGGSNILFAEQKRSDCKLRAAQEENLALAAVAERERIARDLHDVLGHTLSVITLKAELAGRLLAKDSNATERAAKEIADVERLARTSLAEVREAITGYRTRGLAAEIEAARYTLDAAGVTLTLEQRDGSSTKNLSVHEETVLALALREAVTNIVRHAHATTCTLRFVTSSNGGARILIIEDNGGAPAPPREGNGLRGMRARIESIGGGLTLEAGSGTRLLITLPQAMA